MRPRNWWISRCQRSDPAIEYLVGDAQRLGFLSPNAFSAASCILAIQNIEDIRPVFEGVARALGPPDDWSWL